MSIFSNVFTRKPRLNKFDLSHERKLSLKMGDLVPIFVQDVVPGDKFRVKSEIFMRLAPMLAPIMHRVNVYTHYFFVPNRLIWTEWEDFITGGREGTSNPIAPYYFFTAGSENFPEPFGVGSLCDYMGLPIFTGEGGELTEYRFSQLPFRAYQEIYNEFYRDQNLQAPVEIYKGSGMGLTEQLWENLLSMRQRAWEKDYFTSALPWAQRGGEVLLPIEPVVDTVVSKLDGEPVGTAGDLSADNTGQLIQQTGIPNEVELRGDGVSATINELRRSIRLQEWLEKNARGGARYTEQILSHFGVVSSDARLQRPQYLGGGKQNVMISEVLQTAQDSTEPLATMAGHGVAVGNTNGFSRRFEEHGYVIGIMSVLPKTAYQQGIPRHLTRFDRFEYYWPEFANIGEQEVKVRELWIDPLQELDPDEVFGYQSRYAEYKYGCSSVHGEFRDSLSFWHMGRIFENKPQLNEQFVTSDPTDRVFAVPTAPDKLYCQIYHKTDALRPMPYFGTPTL